MTALSTLYGTIMGALLDDVLKRVQTVVISSVHKYKKL